MSNSKRLRAALRGKRIALAVTAAFLPWDAVNAQTTPPPNTLPTNGTFAAGTGTIHTPTPENYLRVDQSSTKGIINWDTFSIGSAAHVHFNHDAGRAGMTLNRVTTNEASQIYGRLSSTGQIFLVNNAGVLFAPGASVNVGALLASTLSITDQNFLEGNYQFYNPGSAGSVTNQGSIITSGGYTALLGPQVSNEGVILASAGKVALAAGNAVSLTIADSLISVVVAEPAYKASVINTGTVQADGGTVLLKAKSLDGLLDTVINTSGVVRASSLVERNGEIVLEGTTGMVVASGTVDAAGVSISGGSIWGSGILADSLSTRSRSSTILSGENRVASYNGTSVDRLFFFNRGDLNVTSLQAASADVSLDGSLTISGPWTTGGPTTIGAWGALAESSGGFIEASGTSSLSGGASVDLRGPNRISGTLFGGSNQGNFALSNTGDLKFSAFAGSAAFPGPWGVPGNPRDINLVNTGTLDVMSLAGRNLAVSNAGPMSISGFWTSSEETSIRTAGSGSDLTVASSVFSNGHMTVNIDGALTLAAGLQASPPPPTPDLPPFPPMPQVLTMTSSAGQDIVAKSIHVSATSGGFASINNQSAGNQNVTATEGGIQIGSAGGAAPGVPTSTAQIRNTGTGNQTITVAGAGGLELHSNGGSAHINNGLLGGAGIQTISVSGGPGVVLESRGGNVFISQDTSAAQSILIVDADHIKVNGVSGGADISANGGMQTVSITGTGANVLRLGEIGNVGFSQIFGGGTQAITAGTGNQAGSIGITGSNMASSFTGISSRQLVDGTQTVSTSGTLRVSGGAALNTPPFGSSAGVFHSGSGEQTVRAANLEVNGGSGGVNNGALIFSSGGGAIPAGNQVIDVPGRIAVQGGSGSNNFANIVSSAKQTITAGSVELQGGSAGSGNGAFLNSILGGGQVFTVAGELKIAGGTGGGAGIVNGTNTPVPGTTTPNTNSAPQTINAGSVTLTGAPGGSNNGAFINSTFGGDQTLNVPGEIKLTGGSGGAGNRAGIQTNASQTITGNSELVLKGGDGGTGNNVFIQATSGDVAKPQVINARGIEVRSGAGFDASATLNAARNVITTTGDVSIYGGGGQGGSNGARIGGIGGGVQGPTNLTLSVGGDLLLQAGMVNGASLGSSGGSAQSNTIMVTAANVTLESKGAGARIGASNQTPVPAGDISVTAAGDLQIGAGTAIRTAGTVTLDADTVVELANGRIIAGTLNIHTIGDAVLTGPNEVAHFTAATDMGNVSFTNIAPVLTLGSMDLPGALTVDQAGALRVGAATATAPTIVYAAGDISIAAGNVTIQGGAAAATPAVLRGRSVSMMLDGNLAVTGGSADFSPAVLSSGSNIDLTVGGQVRVDAGSGYLSLARIQTEIRDGVIHITFPNLSGGYFVNGIEGDNHQGQTGFFTLNKPAKLGSTLLVDYGT